MVGSIATSSEVRGLLLLVFVPYRSVDPYVYMDYVIRIFYTVYMICMFYTDHVIRMLNLNIRIN